MVAIMGTSTCHVMSADVLREVPGMCGVVDGGIVAGLLGLRGRPERCRRHLRLVRRAPSVPASYADAAAAAGRVRARAPHPASPPQQAVGEHGLVALDWHSGNRSVLVDHELSGLVVGQTLATQPEDVYRALLEATAFGTRVIVETFRDSGVPVEEFIVAGGLAKNALLMQIYADVTRLPLSVIDSEQGPALGSAIHAAVAAGAYPDVPTAAKAMGKVAPRRLPARRGTGRRPTTRSSSSTSPCTTTSAARTTTMRRLKAIRRDAVARPRGERRDRRRRCRRRRSPRCAREVCAAARRADPLPARGVDRRQRLGPGAGRRTCW